MRYRVITTASVTVAMAALGVALWLTAGASAASPVHADPAGVCAGMTPCFTTIQEAVNNAGPAPAQVKVFPGDYVETVDLSLMGSAIAGAPGDLTIGTVDASGAPSPGTATVTGNPLDAFRNTGAFVGNVAIDGFSTTSATADGISIGIDGDVTISNVNSSANAGSGLDIEASGTVTITDSVADDNGESAFPVFGEQAVIMDRLSASNNDATDNSEGIHPESFGYVTISNSTATNTGDDGIDAEAAGNVTITNSTSTSNGDRGIEVDADGVVTIDRVTAVNNGDDSIHVDFYDGDVDGVTVTNSVVGPTADGAVDLDENDFEEGGAYKVVGNIICGSLDGLEVGEEAGGGLPNIEIDGTANWWGSATGPTHPGNPQGTGDLVRDAATNYGGTVSYTPWIDAISGTAGPATLGQAVIVNFAFTGGAGSVNFTDGPGDPNGNPPFTATTDNGTATTSGFVSGGKLAVTLTPATVGKATVTVAGPCGLDGALGGNSVVLDVAAAPSGATPVPSGATPVQLPETGGRPSSGGAPFTVTWLLVFAGLATLVAFVAARARE